MVTKTYLGSDALICPGQHVDKEFHCCSNEVKQICLGLLHSSLHCPLVVQVRKACMYKLQVAYNDCMRILLKQPRWCSASQLFCSVGVTTFHALLRTLMYKFICRLNVCTNSVVKVLVDPMLSDTRYQSATWKHWYSGLL